MTNQDLKSSTVFEIMVSIPVTEVTEPSVRNGEEESDKIRFVKRSLG